MRNILVLRGGALGDFIVTLPALAALKRQWPAARIELAGNATAAALARARGLVDAVHSQHEQRWSTLFRREPLPSEFAAWLDRFDAVVNFWPDADNELSRHFPRLPRQRFVTAPAMPAVAPAAAHYLAALGPLDVSPSPTYFALRPLPRPSGAQAPAVSGETAGDRPVAIHPGSGSTRKNWPVERWLELIATLRSPVLLVIGEVEVADWSKERLATTALAPRVADGSVRLAANLSLEGLVDELSRCRLYLGHDSGVSHLAAACGLPCVLLFGPTDPAMWAPPVPHVRVIRRGTDLAQIATREVIEAAL